MSPPIFSLARTILVFLVVSTFLTSVTFAQDPDVKHSIIFKPQFFQFKDSFNYGLVFSGLNLTGEYSLRRETENGILNFSPKLAFGANYNKGIGLAWQLRPLHFSYTFDIGSNGVKLGPYISSNYQWQLYPELQSGHMFWFSSFEIGPVVELDVEVRGRSLNIQATNSFLGWVSRPEPNPNSESYFYALSASDWLSNVHKDLSFGFNNFFNHTIIVVSMPTSGKTTWGYEFEYFGYYKNPDIKYIVHSINMKWSLGK